MSGEIKKFKCIKIFPKTATWLIVWEIDDDIRKSHMYFDKTIDEVLEDFNAFELANHKEIKNPVIAKIDLSEMEAI